MVAGADNRILTVKTHVRDALNDVGRRGETYSQIIERLITSYKERNQGV
jgi:hypothetical protein